MENRKYHGSRKLRHWLSVPFIWVMIVPLVIMHFFTAIYHYVCFPLWGIPLLKLRDYIKFDRVKLSYLNLFDKVNCTYCSYANGFLNYTVAIAGKTEKYWCGIKHAKYRGFVPSKHQKEFLEYGDEKAFNKYINKPK